MKNILPQGYILPKADPIGKFLYSESHFPSLDPDPVSKDRNLNAKRRDGKPNSCRRLETLMQSPRPGFVAVAVAGADALEPSAGRPDGVCPALKRKPAAPGARASRGR